MKGHFVLSSGRHSDVYVEKFRALEKPPLAMTLGRELADRFRDKAVDVVLSPALGAIVLGFATATHLAARFIVAEREQGRMVLRRGFEIAPGEKVLVIEDVVTTGLSLNETLDLVPPGELVGIGVLVDRSGTSDERVTALARVDASSWEKADCPLCAEGIPETAPGSRHLSAR